jgi:hypothetical protein
VRIRSALKKLHNTMTTFAEISPFLEKLEALRVELTDLAFQLERRGRCDAADLAIAISGRLAELRADACHPVSGTKEPIR